MKIDSLLLTAEKRTMNALGCLRALGILFGTVCLAFGLLLLNHGLTLLGIWSGMCAFNTHRFMTGGSIIGISMIFDAKQGNSLGFRIFSLALWWVPLLIVAAGLIVFWIHAHLQF